MAYVHDREFHEKTDYKYIIFSNDKSSNEVYFAGYLLVKSLFIRLKHIDYRLKDPETFLIFIMGYIFNDSKLHDLMVPSHMMFKLPEEDNNALFRVVTDRVLEHLKSTLSDLLVTSELALKRAVDIIENVEATSAPIWRIDYRAALAGHYVLTPDWTADRQQFFDTMRSLLQLESQEAASVLQINFGLSDDDRSRYEQELFLISDEILTVRSHLIEMLRLLPLECVVIGYWRQPDLSWVLAFLPDHRLAVRLPVQESWLAALLGADSESPAFALDLDHEGLIQALDEDDGLIRIHERWKSKCGEVPACRVNLHCLYIGNPKDPLSIIVAIERGRGVCFAYHPDTSLVPSDETSYVIQLCVPWFNRGSLERLFGLHEFVVDNSTSWIENRLSIANESQHIAWRLFFNKNIVSREELEEFWHYKLPNIMPYCDDDNKQRIITLCRNGSLVIPENDHKMMGVIRQINNGWLAYVGHELIELSNVKPGEMRARWLW